MNSVTPKEATTRRVNALRSIKLLSYEITAAFDLLFVSAIVLGPLATPWFYARARITVVPTLKASPEKLNGTLILGERIVESDLVG
jgi:hypothetical protein